MTVTVNWEARQSMLIGVEREAMGNASQLQFKQHHSMSNLNPEVALVSGICQCDFSTCKNRMTGVNGRESDRARFL